MRLIETTGGEERVIASQVESGKSPRLWWIASGELEAKSKRTYRIESGVEMPQPALTFERRPESILFRVGDSQVLQYNVAHVSPPDSIDPKYGRSAFLHPCWTPAGAIVTDQFSPDHAHQSGLFLAYTKTEFEGRTPNFWDLRGGTGMVRFKELKNITAGSIFGELVVEHEHVELTAAVPKVALVETWNLHVRNLGGRDAGFWVCEITLTVNCATSSQLRLPTYHYGGMALRGARGWNAEQARISTSEGKDRIAGNHTRPRWCDLSGPVGERQAGIAFFTHPENFRAPEPLRIHPTMPYMVYTLSQLGDWEITPASHTCRDINSSFTTAKCRRRQPTGFG